MNFLTHRRYNLWRRHLAVGGLCDGLSGRWVASLLWLYRVHVGCAGRPPPFRVGRCGGDPLAPRLILAAGLIREILSAREIVRRNVAEAGEALERSNRLLAYQVRIRFGPDDTVAQWTSTM